MCIYYSRDWFCTYYCLLDDVCIDVCFSSYMMDEFRWSAGIWNTTRWFVIITDIWVQCRTFPYTQHSTFWLRVPEMQRQGCVHLLIYFAREKPVHFFLADFFILFQNISKALWKGCAVSWTSNIYIQIYMHIHYFWLVCFRIPSA